MKQYTSELKNFYIDENGFGRADGVPIGRIGVQKYLTRNEYRPPDEVFAEEHLRSINGVPLTIRHPNGLLNPVDAKEHAVGAVHNARMSDDGTHIIADLTIYDEDAINAIKGGLRELSLGYTSDDEETSGEYNGERYEAIQRKLRANHLALVDKGRCGGSCRIDGDDEPEAMSVEMVASVVL